MSVRVKLKYAFLKSLPVLFGYLFIGIAFGILLTQSGYNALWALGMSTFIYAGSAQLVLVPLMAGGASVLTSALTVLLINSRHLFYGISFVESFSKMKSRPYMILSLTDETYSVLCGCRTEDPGETLRDCWPLIALMNHLYWILGSLIGALLGTVLPFDLSGIEFSMTALFIVILIDQIRAGGRGTGVIAAAGIVLSAVCLAVFGPDRFLLPAMLLTVPAAAVFSGRREKT